MIGAKYTAGKSKELQLDNYGKNGFRRFFDFEKVSYGQYIINKIYETPLPIVNDRSFGNARGIHKIKKVTKENPHFGIQEDEVALNAGVYKIENDDSIYIGSTINKLTDRFRCHRSNATGLQPKTQELLQNGGVFTCLQSFPLRADEQTIRDSEAYYIWKYKNTNKKLLNTNLPEVLGSDESIGYENINIPKGIYEEVLEYLREGGFLIMGKSMYDKRFKEV